MQAVLGGEMQGLLYVSDLYLSCILIIHTYQWYAPPGSEMGEGGDLPFGHIPIHGGQDGGVLCLYIDIY